MNFYIAMELDRYCKGNSIVNLDVIYCEKAAALPNKKIIIMRRIWRFLKYDTISTKCYKLRQIFASSLGITKQHLRIFRQGWKVNKEVPFCAFY